jgi:hypothetical protein
MSARLLDRIAELEEGVPVSWASPEEAWERTPDEGFAWIGEQHDPIGEGGLSLDAVLALDPGPPEEPWP